MKKFRGPVGWRGESYRHYLAAKGVRTTMAKKYPGASYNPVSFADIWLDSKSAAKRKRSSMVEKQRLLARENARMVLAKEKYRPLSDAERLSAERRVQESALKRGTRTLMEALQYQRSMSKRLGFDEDEIQRLKALWFEDKGTGKPTFNAALQQSVLDSSSLQDGFNPQEGTVTMEEARRELKSQIDQIDADLMRLKRQRASGRGALEAEEVARMVNEGYTPEQIDEAVRSSATRGTGEAEAEKKMYQKWLGDLEGLHNMERVPRTTYAGYPEELGFGKEEDGVWQKSRPKRQRKEEWTDVKFLDKYTKQSVPYEEFERRRMAALKGASEDQKDVGAKAKAIYYEQAAKEYYGRES
jgi:hypothetical protein